MIKVDFRFSATDFEKAILRAAAQVLIRRVESMRCPEHGQHASIVVTGSSASNMDFTVSGCCEKLEEDVKSKLNKPAKHVEPSSSTDISGD